MQDGTEADSTYAESGDSAEGELTPEEQAQKTQEDKIEQLSPQDPKMYLTTYYVEVPVGTTLDKLSYVISRMIQSQPVIFSKGSRSPVM